MERNKSVEVFRGFALLSVLIYHIQCLFGGTILKYDVLTKTINFGGEIGVTLFFIISGFAIYNVLENSSKKGFNYFDYLKKRFKSIAPQYYFCLIFVLLFTGSAIYLSKDSILDLITHFTFTHNFFVSTHGSVNAVLWTMGTIVQFYIIAPLLYKIVKKHPLISCILSMILTIVIKCFLYNIFSKNSLAYPSYFVYGRQLFDTLDNFIFGMILGIIISKNIHIGKFKSFVIFLVSFIILFFMIYVGNRYGAYSNTILGYTWHTIVGIILTLMIYTFGEFIHDFKMFFPILWVAKYEYGIYLWHFVLVGNLLNTPGIKSIRENSTFICFIVLMIACLFVGCYSTKLCKNLKVDLKSKKG